MLNHLDWWIYGILAVWLILYIIYRVKFPKLGSMSLVSGGVKTGKTTFALACCLETYRRVLFKWKFRRFFWRMFHSKKKHPNGYPVEKPLFYSNIPLCGVDYVPVTDALLARQERFVYGSVIYISEVSLVADSQLIKSQDLNERLLLFNKLIGHETHGGLVVYDTQSISDCHYSVKRCLSSYFYIHHVTKLPFFLLVHFREYKYSEDNGVVMQEDVEDNLHWCFVPKSVWKKFDCYCYSSFTDDLPVENHVIKAKKLKWKYTDLKVKKLCSFRTFKSLPEKFVDKFEDGAK